MTANQSACIPNFSLMYLQRFNIKNKRAGLREPSGLVLSTSENALWTISDDTNKIFKIGLDGSLKKEKSFTIPDKELEGITLLPSNDLLAVKESTNEIIRINIDTQRVTERRILGNMKGYDHIAQFFDQSSNNKGLEGITWNIKSGSIVVLKEGEPGLLVEISYDLQTILSCQVLTEENGFCDNKLAFEDIDYSDICYDAVHDLFLIISDKAERLFIYDWQVKKVLQSTRLGYGDNGKYRQIKKAEGIALNAEGNRLYVVSDSEARLYIYDFRY